MTIFDRTRCNLTINHTTLPALSLVLLGMLTACGDNGVDNNANNDTTVDTVSDFTVTPSLGAAQLASIASGSDTAPEEESSTGTPNSAELTANAQTSFTSVNNSSFEGEVLDDGIHLQWEPNASARGFNVYRQGEYQSTVFTNEFTDNIAYDGDYYYEIEAFDQNDIVFDVTTGLTVSTRKFGVTDPDAPQPKRDLLDNYELVFSDEFTGMELDTSKWSTRLLWGPNLIINNEEQYYVDIINDPDFGYDPFSFDGESLTISTVETPTELVSKANDQQYLSGIITSYDSFKFTYGYAEARMKFAYGRGYWPAFWLLCAYYGGPEPEVDIMEFLGHDQDVAYHTYHYFDSNGELRSTPSKPVNGKDFTSHFHTFGLEWKPGLFIFYVDGVETHRISDVNVSSEEMYVIANQAVGGWWAGPPDFTTPIPGEFVIDYIRVYQSVLPYDDFQSDQTTDQIPLFSDAPEKTTPNHKPPFWEWPEGYPSKQ